MSAFEPILIDDSDTRQVGASLDEDDVLNFEGSDMPLSQLDTTSGGGDEAGFGTTLVPAKFFCQHGAEGDASELESYSGDEVMFTYADDDVEEMDLDSQDGDQPTRTWAHEYSPDPLGSDPESEPEPEPLVKNKIKTSNRTGKDTHLSRASKQDVQAWGHAHKLTQAVDTLTRLANSDPSDVSASLKLTVAEIAKEVAQWTDLIRKCDLTVSSRKDIPTQLTDEDDRHCGPCITAGRSCIGTTAYLKRWEADSDAAIEGKHKPKADKHKRPPSCWSCTSGRAKCTLPPAGSTAKRIKWAL